MDQLIALAKAFKNVKDPRINRAKKHNLADIITLTLCATMCGMDNWEDIEWFAEVREDWLRKFLDLPNGIPSHDTIYRVFSRINPKQLNEVLVKWTNGLNNSLEGKVVAIDGKTLRRSFDTAAGTSALHVVSAWVQENNLVLGQVATDTKGTEIAKIPELLRMLELKNSIVTIDAIGCQKEIIRVIREEKKADYVIALKANQMNLYNEVIHFFKVAEKSDFFTMDYCESLEKGHGRIETRHCICLNVDKHLEHVASDFKDLRTIAKISSIREVRGKQETSDRYFISSLPCNAKQIAHAVRTHWGVENSLHWRLDVVFNEDSSRIRKDHAPENMALIRRMAINLIKPRLPAKTSVRQARRRMGLSLEYAQNLFIRAT